MKHKNILRLIILITLFVFIGCSRDNRKPDVQPQPVTPTKTSVETPTRTPTKIPTAVEHNWPDAGSVGLDDPYYPQLGNGGYDVQHYTIDLYVAVNGNQIIGNVTIEATALQDLGSFNLDLSGLEVEEIRVDGEIVKFQRDQPELIIFLPSPISAGTDFTVSINYGGVPEGISVVDIGFLEGWVNYGGGIMVAGEPVSSQSWYPVNDHPLDKAAYSFIITVDKPYVVAANGLLKETIDNGDTVTYIWESQDPIASYLVTVGIGDFDVEEEIGPNGLPIRNYFGSGISDGIRSNFDNTAEMIEYFNTIFGEYPFEAYGVIVHDMDLGFALETQTLSIFGNSFADEDVVVHELAHQWFGDSVSLSSWDDIWLNEGFATYASILWFEYSLGSEDAEEYIEEVYGYLVEDENYLPPAGDPSPDDLFSASVYYRGALTLHALRMRVGDEMFFDILQTYFARFKNGNATTEDFIAVVEEISGEEFDDFFDAWLYQREMPDIPEAGLFREDFVD